MYRLFIPWCMRLSTLLRRESIESAPLSRLSLLFMSEKPWLIEGRMALPDCEELRPRPESGVVGTECREGESSGFRSVCTWRPLLAEVSVLMRSVRGKELQKFNSGEHSTHEQYRIRVKTIKSRFPSSRSCNWWKRTLKRGEARFPRWQARGKSARNLKHDEGQTYACSVNPAKFPSLVLTPPTLGLERHCVMTEGGRS